MGASFTDPRPWVVVAVFPGHKPKAIARTCYKTDADAYVRFLQRYMSQGVFYVIFDPQDQPPHSPKPPEF